MSALAHANTLYAAIRHMGFFGGIRSYGENAVARLSGRSGLSRTSVRSLPAPLYFRPGSSDWYALTQIFLNSEYDSGSPEHEAALCRRYRDILAAGKRPLIVDCGANVGFASVWFSARFPRARIVAIEPQPDNVEVLRLNAAAVPSVRVVHAAVSDRAGQVDLRNTRENAAWAWETVESRDGAVRTVTIASLLNQDDGDEELVPLIVKIDIEGFEVELFRSNTSWVDAAPLIVFESHDHGYCWRGTAHAILSILTRQPRDYIQHNENTFAFSHDLLGPGEGEGDAGSGERPA